MIFPMCTAPNNGLQRPRATAPLYKDRIGAAADARALGEPTHTHKLMKEKEYETLRKEIMQWQAQRFAVASGTLVVVFAILGWSVNASDKWSWPVLSSVILALLTLVAYLSWLMGLFMSRISTYLEVFHEKDSTTLGWERRHRVPHRHFFSSKGAYAALYFVLAVVSTAVSIFTCGKAASQEMYVLFAAFVIFFLVMLWVLIFRSHPWARYLEQWNDLKTQEMNATDP
jgi:membrane protein YdbS with pleckstrin-like domain